MMMSRRDSALEVSVAAGWAGSSYKFRREDMEFIAHAATNDTRESVPVMMQAIMKVSLRPPWLHQPAHASGRDERTPRRLCQSCTATSIA